MSKSSIERPANSYKGVPLRQWSAASYGLNGHAASSVEMEHSPNADSRVRPTNQIEQTHAAGVHGAPSMVTRTARCVQGPQPGPRSRGR